MPRTGHRLSPGPMSPAEPGTRRLPRDRAAAVTALFDVHYARMVRLAWLLVDDRETAEDVVMDAFAALYRRWSAIRDPDDTYRYLRSCVLNGARSHLRRRRRVRIDEADVVDPGAVTDPGTLSDPAADGTNRVTVIHLLRSLPRRQREVLALRFLLDLPEAAIAETLGISTGSVKTHTSRGLAALADAMEVHR